MIKVGSTVRINKHPALRREQLCQYIFPKVDKCNGCPVFLEKPYKVISCDGKLIHITGEKANCPIPIEKIGFFIDAFVLVYNWIPLKEIK